MAVHRGAVHPDGLVLERCRDEIVQEQRLAEILVTDDLDPGPTKPQNLPDIADPKAARRSAYIHSEGRKVDAFLARRPVRESSQTQQAARQ